MIELQGSSDRLQNPQTLEDRVLAALSKEKLFLRKIEYTPHKTKDMDKITFRDIPIEMKRTEFVVAPLLPGQIVNPEDLNEIQVRIQAQISDNPKLVLESGRVNAIGWRNGVLQYVETKDGIRSYITVRLVPHIAVATLVAEYLQRRDVDGLPELPEFPNLVEYIRSEYLEALSKVTKSRNPIAWFRKRIKRNEISNPES